MKRRLKVLTSPPVSIGLALLLTLCWIAPGALARQLAAVSPAPAGPQARDTLRGTVRAIDATAGNFDVVTGVGMALRIVRLRAGAGTYVTAAGAPASLADIKPGDIVRVEYRVTPQGNVCDKVERLGRMGGRPGGAP